MLKVGIGYDVHRLIPNRLLILGGVKIPFDKGLDGHSDADVVVHAISDALLGAVALGDIGYLIEKLATQNNFSVVKDFCGHGIGKNFHEAPSVLHYGSKGEGLKLKEGMIFTIEPMLNAGTNEIKILGDGWTAITKDRKLSAQFEHTIGVTKNGYEIFTLSPKDFHKPPY